MSLVFKSFFIILSVMMIESHSLHFNSSRESPDITKKTTLKIVKTSDKGQDFTNRQSSNTLGVGGPVAAGLAFVGLNLAFISLLVPFVLTAVASGERRNYHSDDVSSLLRELDKLGNIYGFDLNDLNHSDRSSSNESRDVMDKIARFGHVLLTHIKKANHST